MVSVKVVNSIIYIFRIPYIARAAAPTFSPCCVPMRMKRVEIRIIADSVNCVKSEEGEEQINNLAAFQWKYTLPKSWG
jgi:hypothetical protein